MTQSITLLIRSIMVGRFYSVVSVAGLAIAIAVVILVGALLQHELKYEKNYSASDRIYRLNWVNGGTGDRFATMFNPFSVQFAEETAEVSHAARVGIYQVLVERDAISAGQGISGLPQVAFVDPAFFEIFDLRFEAGDPDSALASPNSIVLTRAMADNFFPDGSALGESLTLESNVTLTVTAIIENMPANTHFPFHLIAPLETLRDLFEGAGWLDNWGSDQLYHYVLLNEGATQASLDERTMDFARRHVPYDDWNFTIASQALPEIHFSPDLQNEMPLRDDVLNILKAPRNKSDLMLFSAGALILALIASFNFMNLQIARGFGRSKQLGLLKVVGASRGAVFKRMLSESVLFSFLSLFVALMIVELSLGLFANTIAVDLHWADVLQPDVLAGVIALTLILGLVSGAYPAWLMASQKPGLILKGEFSHGHGVHRIRQVLVLLQFTVSIILIAIALGIYGQIRFSLSAPLGFDANDIAVVAIDRSDVRENYETLRIRTLEHPEVSMVSRSSIIPTGNLSDGMSLDPDGGGPRDHVAMRLVNVDYDFFEALNIELAAGRAFHRDFGAEVFTFPNAENPLTSAGIMINEAAARRAGWTNPEDAIGREMREDFDFGGTSVSIIVTVIGVVKNVHFRSLRSEIVPMAFLLGPHGNHMIVKTSGADASGVAAHIENVWRETVTESPLQLDWLDSKVAALYVQETRVLNLMAGVSVIGIAVACLGLFAVASLITESRRKEVALRKVFGATMLEIVNLLSWKFLKIVIVANLLAWPVAWLYMNAWLNNFIYRIDFGVMQLVIPGMITFAIAWLTVAGQAWIAVRNNPIHALRYE